MQQGNFKITVIKPKISAEDIANIIKKQHTWFWGLIPPRSFTITRAEDIYMPYILTGVSYYKKIGQKRRCYVFDNQYDGLKSGVMGIENIEFIEIDLPVEAESIHIDEKKYAAEIAHYCNLELLAKNYRKFINWNIDILEVRKIYRHKQIIHYDVNGKSKHKEIYLDCLVLK